MERIAKDKVISTLIHILKLILSTLVVVYITGLLWYRFSDRW